MGSSLEDFVDVFPLCLLVVRNSNWLRTKGTVGSSISRMTTDSEDFRGRSDVLLVG